jgi:phosphoribosylanthranilate isomerase
VNRSHPPYEFFPLMVKICGLTREEDIRWAIECGASFLGIVLCDSPRQVRGHRIATLIWAARELEPSPPVLAVVQDPGDREITRLRGLGFDGVQLHGDETPERVREISALDPDLVIWKAIRVGSEADLALIPRFSCNAVLLDSRVAGEAGGTGKRIEIAAERIREAACKTNIVVAGGLDPQSVIDAVVDFEPYGVDVSSGVEASPGVKDPEKVKTFIENAKAAAELRAIAHRQHHRPEEKPE